MRSDNAQEFKKAVKFLGIHPGTCVTNNMSSKGYVEIRVLQVSEGGRALLKQPALPLCVWVKAIIAWCRAHNQGITFEHDGVWLMPYEIKHGHVCPWPRIPFGAKMHGKSSPEEIKRNHKFADSAIECVFMGWRLKNGGHTSDRGYPLPVEKLL